MSTTTRSKLTTEKKPAGLLPPRTQAAERLKVEEFSRLIQRIDDNLSNARRFADAARK